MIRSIRARLMLGLVLALSIALTLVISASWYGARRELASLFDAHLRQSAAIILLWAQTEPRSGETLNVGKLGSELQSLLPLMQSVHLRRRESEPTIDDLRELAYAIVCDMPESSVEAHGCISVESPNAPALLQDPSPSGFSEQRQDEVGGNARWHIYTLRDAARHFTVRVAERDDIRHQIITNIVLRQSGISLILLPLAGILVWFVIGQGLRPLRLLSEQINARSGDLLEPVTTETPREVSVLVDALNRLFDKVAAAFDRERRFSADVAHELRTPLSVIKTTAQLSAADFAAEDRSGAHLEIIRQCERAARVLDQLLELARVDSELLGQRRQTVDLAALAREVMADLAAQADARNVDLVLSASEGGGRISAEPVTVSILLRNLLENAIRHSPVGAEVGVEIESEDSVVRLSVRDQGSGLSAVQLEQLQAILSTEDTRLSPAALNADQSGYGLGFLLVQRIALLHGAQVELREEGPGSGLRVLVSFIA